MSNLREHLEKVNEQSDIDEVFNAAETARDKYIISLGNIQTFMKNKSAQKPLKDYRLAERKAWAKLLSSIG